MDADIAERFALAEELVVNAGRLALDYWRHIDILPVNFKGVQDLVSEADVAVEKLIKDTLQVRYPSDAFLGEETGHADFPAAPASGSSTLSTALSRSSRDWPAGVSRSPTCGATSAISARCTILQLASCSPVHSEHPVSPTVGRSAHIPAGR